MDTAVAQRFVSYWRKISVRKVVRSLRERSCQPIPERALGVKRCGRVRGASWWGGGFAVVPVLSETVIGGRRLVVRARKYQGVGRRSGVGEVMPRSFPRCKAPGRRLPNPSLRESTARPPRLARLPRAAPGDRGATRSGDAGAPALSICLRSSRYPAPLQSRRREAGSPVG